MPFPEPAARLTPEVTICSPANCAVSQVIARLGVEGLYVVRCFQQTSACAPISQNICPHTGKGPCSCRVEMLLVYGPWPYPVPVIAHEHGGQTEFGLYDVGCRAAETEAERRVRAALGRLANRFN